MKKINLRLPTELYYFAATNQDHYEKLDKQQVECYDTTYGELYGALRAIQEYLSINNDDLIYLTEKEFLDIVPDEVLLNLLNVLSVRNSTISLIKKGMIVDLGTGTYEFGPFQITDIGLDIVERT